MLTACPTNQIGSHGICELSQVTYGRLADIARTVQAPLVVYKHTAASVETTVLLDVARPRLNCSYAAWEATRCTIYATGKELAMSGRLTVCPHRLVAKCVLMMDLIQ